MLDGQIVKYEWDLDSDGDFEIDGGANPIQQAEFDLVGARPVVVRVTNDSGNSDTAAISLDVAAQAPAGCRRCRCID